MKKVKLYITLLSAVWLAASTIALGQNKAEVFLDLDHGRYEPSEISLSSNEKFLLTKNLTELRLWDFDTEKLIKSLSPEKLTGLKYAGSVEIMIMPSGKTAALRKNRDVDESSKIEGVNYQKIFLADVALERPIGPALKHETTSDAPFKNMFSPDGTKIAVYNAGQIEIYATQSADKLQSVPFDGIPHQMFFTKDGSHILISKKEQDAMKFYSLETKTWWLQAKHSGRISGGHSVISADGQRAMTITNLRNVEYWDVNSGEVIRSYKLRRRDVKKTELKRAFLSDDGKIAVLEYMEGKYYPRYGIVNNETGEVYGFFRHDEFLIPADNIVITSEHKRVYLDLPYLLPSVLFNLQKPGMIKDWGRKEIPDELSIESKTIGFNAFFGSDGAVTVRNGQLVKISMTTGEVLSSFGDKIATPAGIGILDGGNKLLAGKHIWDTQTGQIIETLTSDVFESYELMHTSPDHNKILFRTKENSKVLQEFDLDTKSITARYKMVPQEDAFEHHWFRYSSNGRYLMMQERDVSFKYATHIRIWDTESADLVRAVNLKGGHVSGFDIAPDAKKFTISAAYNTFLPSSEHSAMLELYDVASGTKKATIATCKGDMKCSRNYHMQQFSPDDSYLLYGLGFGHKDSSAVYDLEAKKTVRYVNNALWQQNKLLGNKRLFIAERSSPSMVFGKVIDVETGEVLEQNRGIRSQAGKSFTYGNNGEIEIKDAKTDSLIASSFMFSDGEWVTITPQGYYMASQGGADHLNVRMGLQVYSMDNFFETYYRPDIVQAALQGKQSSQFAGTDIREDAQLPPTVQFTSHRSGFEAKQQQVTLTAEITDQGGGIDEVRLFHNGKLIEGGTRGLKLLSGSKTITREFEVNLLPGTNEFELTALSTGQRIESNPAKLTIDYKGTVATSDLYVLAVGLNEYKNNSLNLNYGRPDAEAFVSSLKKKSGGIFKSVNVTTLYDGQATRSGVKAAFEDIISKAKPQDAFLFFYAGHGVMSEPEGQQQGDFYMALHEATQLYGNNAGLRAHGISAAEMTDLTRRIAAHKQMIVLDACQSGGAVETFAMRGAAEQKAIIQLARSAGLVVMASTGTEQYATEFDALGHGVFTYALLNGLQGQADGGSKDGKITVKELEAFINDRVPALTEKHRGQSQYPNSYARGQDFPIGVIK